MTLDELKIGQSGRITAVGGGGDLRLRLLDMGLIPRTVVTLQKRAPMGDPIEIRLRGYELTLRTADAARIDIVPVEEGSAEAALAKSGTVSSSARCREFEEVKL